MRLRCAHQASPSLPGSSMSSIARRHCSRLARPATKSKIPAAKSLCAVHLRKRAVAEQLPDDVERHAAGHRLRAEPLPPTMRACARQLATLQLAQIAHCQLQALEHSSGQGRHATHRVASLLGVRLAKLKRRLRPQRPQDHQRGKRGAGRMFSVELVAAVRCKAARRCRTDGRSSACTARTGSAAAR